MLCHGPVRVPEDARPGKAVLRFELPADSDFESVPTDLADYAAEDSVPLVTLSRAVRLSSNFPYGFHVARCATGPGRSVDILDGGVVDDTGIDSAYHLFDGLRREANGSRSDPNAAEP